MTELERLRFRVATYNVLDPGFGTLAPWDDRRGNVAETIRSAEPSIVALQEAGWTRLPSGRSVAEDLAALTGLMLSPASFSGDGILFDPQLWTAGEYGHFLLPRGRGDRRRSMIWQRFGHESSGAECLFVATHLSHGPERDRARIRQARRLVRRTRSINRGKLPTIVLGDLNSWGGRAPVTPIDVICAAGYREAIPRAHPTDSAELGTLANSRREQRLDHVVVSPDLRTVDAAIADPTLAGPASDHRLVWADLELNRQFSRSTP